MKAGPVGPGAGVLMTEYLLPNVMPEMAKQKMAQAVVIGKKVAYVRLAEQVISSKIADPLLGVGWHLEDPDGETIDDAYDDPRAVEAYALVARPMENMRETVGAVRSREEIWEITSRHMGLAGQGAWYLDALNDFGIPAAIAYIRPDRLDPAVTEQGVILGWTLDKRPGYAGTKLDADEIMLIQIQTPDEGVWAPGLVESAHEKVNLNPAIDKHFGAVLAGGGRLSGILSPKTGAIEDDAVYNQLARDWRNIAEQPESARRLQVVRAPTDFTRTVATMDEMKLIDLMGKNRDDLLAVWRVPLSQIGGSSPTGLNSGEVRKYDEAALWQNAVTPRLSKFNTAYQTILDRYRVYLGWAPKIVFDIPTFDDDSPRYDKVQKSQFAPLLNWERRSVLGFTTITDVMHSAGLLPDGQTDPRDYEIIMSNTQVPYEDLGKAPASESSVGGGSSSAFGGKAQDLADAMTSKTQKGPQIVPAVIAGLAKQWPLADLAIVKQGTWKYNPAYPLKKIDAAKRPIARNPKIVAGVEAALKVGAPIDPVTLIHVKRLGNDLPTEPIDGWHRLLAAQHQGLDTIPAYIGKGDDDWTRKLIAFDDDIPTPPDSPSLPPDAPMPPDAAKASPVPGLKKLRATVEQHVTPALRGSVAAVLAQQKAEIVARVVGMADHIKRKPADLSIWWKGDKWDAELSAAMTPHLTDAAQTIAGYIGTQIRSGKAAPQGAVARVLARGAARVTQINETTRDGIKDLIVQGIDAGLSPRELGDSIEAWSGFDEYRAERIATTELMDAYNAAALGSYADLGVQMVEAIDGDGDQECIDRLARNPYTLEDADAEEDHPNGTLDWAPIIDEPAKAQISLKAKALALIERVMASDDDDRAQIAVLAKAVLDLGAREIPAPVVNVAPAEVTVNVPEQRATRTTFLRDERGQAIGSETTPV